MATVTALTAKSIYEAYCNFIFPKTQIDEVILGGGGAYNPQIIKLLKEYFGENIKILTHEDFGISNKYKEAMAFALLAYTTYYNIPNNVLPVPALIIRRFWAKLCRGIDYPKKYCLSGF